MEGLNKNQIVSTDLNLEATLPTPSFSNGTGQDSSTLDIVYEDILNKAENDVNSPFLYAQKHNSKQGLFTPTKDVKLKTYNYDVSLDDAYVQLNSGNYVSRFENFIPNTDNETRFANQQSTGEKWLNGVAKFGTNTLNTVIGGTIGTVYGVGKMVSEGSMQSVFDNDFSRYLDDLNTKMRYKLPNHYTKQERNTSFNVGTANFWADKVLGAAAFTVGAIVSEGIWATATGGASLTTASARWAGRLGKAGKWSSKIIGKEATKKGLSSYKSWMKKPLFNAYKKTGLINKDAAILASRTAEGLNTARFLLTSSGYEAGVEALHYKKEAEENFHRTFYELNGRQPNNQEISDFRENVENSANAVFGGNMALLSVSNYAMFGSLFNLKNPFKQTSKGINRRLFGIGVEETTEKGVFKALTPTKNQKLFSGVYSIGKPLFTEGIFEEGGQGSFSKGANHWIESSYNPKYNGTTIDIMEAMYEGMADTYGTKEGWEEIGIGFIIGGGASIIQGKGKPLDLKQIQEARKNQENIIEKMNTFGQDVLVQRMVANNKIQGAVERELKANKDGNSVEAELANQDKFLAEIEFRHAIGEDITELPETYRIALENMTEEQFKEAGVENPSEYIDTVMNAYTNVVKSYKKNIQYSEAITGEGVQENNYDTKANLSQVLAYVLTTGESSSRIMEDTLGEIESEIGTENGRALRLKSELERLTRNQRISLSKQVSNLKAKKDKQEKLIFKIQEVQNAPKETEGDRKSGAELASLNKSLIETQKEIATIEGELQRFTEELSQEKTRREGFEQNSELELPTINIISAEDLQTIDDKINNINTLINSYKGHNPQLHRKLVTLTDRYEQARKSFEKYNTLGVGLSSGQVKLNPKKAGGLLGKLFDKKKYTQDEFTQAFLSDMLGHYIDRKASDLNRDVVEEDVDLDELYIPVTEQRIERIAEKIRNNQPLSKREKRLYENNKETVDNKLSEINKEKGDNPLETKPAEDTTQSEVDQLKQRLETAMREDYYPLQYVGEEYEELVKNKPSQSDIDRYRELVDKDRLAEEESEFEELQQKLSNWRVLDSAVSGTQSLADIINLIQQLETQVEQDETVTEVTEEFDTQVIDDSLGSGSMVVYELTQNTSGNATAKLLNNGRIKLSHIKIDTILERLGGTHTKSSKKRSNAYVTLSETSEEGSEVQPAGGIDVEKGDVVYTITPEGNEGSINIIVKPTGAIEMEQGDFINLQQSLNLYIVDSGQINWTYKDVYEVVGEEFVEKSSDFVDDDISGDPYNLKVDDTIEFYYDADDSWNKDLYKKYKKGTLTKEQFRNQVKIYIRKDGKNYGTLKSMRESSVDENMLSIRDKATAVAENEINTTLGSTKVSQVMLGSPKFILNDSNKPTELAFTDRAIEEVVTTGYILDNEFTLADKTLEEKVDQSFVGKVSNNQKGKKIPVVVIKKGAHMIAYPVSIVKKDNSQLGRLEAILNNEFSNENEKVTEINDLLISLGISPSVYNLIDLNEQKLEQIGKDLLEHKVYTTANDLADKYNKELLKYDATIKIDLEDLNRSISSPKVRIDLDDITIYQTSEIKYENMTELENILSDLSLEVDSIIMNDYVNSKGDAIENKFTDVYADDSVIKNPENQLEKMHNVRMLLEAFPIMPPKFKGLLGQDKVNQIKQINKKIEFLKNQVDTKTVPEVINKKNELEC